MEKHELTQKVNELLKISSQNEKKEIELTKEIFKLSRKELVGKKICITPQRGLNSFEFINVIDIKKSNWGNNNHIAFKGDFFDISQYDGGFEYYADSRNLHHKYIGEIRNIILLTDEQWESVMQFATQDKQLCEERKQFLQKLIKNNDNK